MRHFADESRSPERNRPTAGDANIATGAYDEGKPDDLGNPSTPHTDEHRKAGIGGLVPRPERDVNPSLDAEKQHFPAPLIG